MIAIPPLFLERMRQLLGDEYPAFLACYEQPASIGIRVNTLKLNPAELIKLSPFDLEPIPWCATGFKILQEKGVDRESYGSPGKHPYHAAGLYYLQEPSAMLVGEILAPQPGERVLDLSASPGGKTTHLAASMQAEGLLVANEIHPGRVWDLAENLERWGVCNAAIANETPERLADQFGGFFDRVLVDAPCSGEGMFRKSEAARLEWSPGLVQYCANRQLGILQEAARLVRPGGLLAYSTCTFAPQENEAVIAQFLASQRDGRSGKFELLDLHSLLQAIYPHSPGLSGIISPGNPEWAGLSSLELSDFPLQYALRLWPQRGGGEGHFMALLRCISQDNPPNHRPWKSEITPETRRLFRTFYQENLSVDLEDDRLYSSGSYLYLLPPGLPESKNLRWIHPGWWLGTLKKNRCEPSHALAMGLHCKEALQMTAFQAGAPQILAFLRGETLRSEGKEGWTLVAIQGYSNSGCFPIGWARRVKDSLKNHYPHGLRWTS